MSTLEDYTAESQLVPFNSIPLPTVHLRIKQLLQRYEIPADEVAENVSVFQAEKERYAQRRQQSIDHAITEYNSENGLFVRFFELCRRGFRPYVPLISTQEPPPEYQLFKNLIDLQKEVERGYELLVGLPLIVEQIGKNYNTLEQREAELKFRMRVHSEVLTEPQKDQYILARDLLSQYNNSDNEKNTQLNSLFFVEGEHAPSLDNPAVREIYIKLINQKLAYQEENHFGLQEAMTLDKEDLERVQRDKSLLLEQYFALNKSCQPAIKAVHRLHRQYSTVRTFAPSARLAIGLNTLREESVELILRSHDIIEDARTKIRESGFVAEGVEEVVKYHEVFNDKH